MPDPTPPATTPPTPAPATTPATPAPPTATLASSAVPIPSAAPGTPAAATPGAPVGAKPTELERLAAKFAEAKAEAQTPEVAEKVARPTGPPDAVFINMSLSKRTDLQGHSMELDALARKIMQRPPGSKGGLWSSVQDNYWKFFRAKPGEELLFPDGHALAKQPRYRWFPEGPLVAVGYLKPEAIQEMQDRENLSPAQPAIPGSIQLES